ncbi:MAG: T9SS type A sorting domain-containing protein, partial [Flavobacteriales bacterium]
NPGNDQITVEFPAFAFADQMELYDAWGKKVLVVRIARERTLVDVSILPPGFYAYRLVNTAKGTVANGTWLKQ